MFSLSFLNSSLLIASLSALIPILIYFFAKRRPDRVIFSSLKFIISSKEERKSKINLKNILLLIIRTLIILFLTLLFARPILKTFLGIDSNYHAPTTISVIADNSLSMDYYSQSTQRLELLKEKLKVINSKLTNDDYLRIYTKDSFITSQKFMQGSIPDSLIAKINVTYNPLPLDSLISQAINNKEQIPTANHEIYLFTDGNEPITLLDSLTNIKYSIIDQQKEWNNLAANINSSQVVSNNNIKQLSIDYTIHNYGTKDLQDRLVRLNYNDRSFDRFISIEANKSWQGNFTIPIEKTGWQKGFIEIQDEYYLQDNRGYFSFYFNLNPNITIITEESNVSLPLQTMISIFAGNPENIKYVAQNRVNNQLISSTDIFIFYKLNSLASNIQSLLDQLDKDKRGSLVILSPDSDSSVSTYVKSNFDIEVSKGLSKNQYPDWTNTYNEIMQEISSNQFQEMRFNDLVKAQINSKNKSILTANKQPLIATNNNTYLLFFDDNNDFVTSASYPVFMNKLFEKLSNSNLEIKSYYQGNSIDLPKGALVNNKEVFSSKFIFKDLGIYKVVTGSKIAFYAVNQSENQLIESINSSSTIPDRYINITGDLESNLFSESGSFELLKYLLYAILFLFLAELLLVKLGK